MASLNNVFYCSDKILADSEQFLENVLCLRINVANGTLNKILRDVSVLVYSISSKL